MKRIIVYIGILVAMLAMPTERSDVGKLLPVQVVSIYKEGDWTIIETDTEDLGMGGTPEQALRNLLETASGIIYLDTAEYLLLTKETQEAAQALRDELKPDVRLCLAASRLDLKETGKYLSVHGQLPKLKDWNADMELPILGTFADALTFLKKVENNA